MIMFTYGILSHRSSKSKFTDIGLFSLSLWTLISDSYFLVPLPPRDMNLTDFQFSSPHRFHSYHHFP